MYFGVVSFVMVLFATLLSKHIAEVIYFHLESVILLKQLLWLLEIKIGLLRLEGKDP